MRRHRKALTSEVVQANSPNTRAQADTAQIGITNRRRSVADKLGAGCAVAQLNTSQRSEPGQVQTSNCAGKFHASILSASRFANRRFGRPWIGFLQASFRLTHFAKSSLARSAMPESLSTCLAVTALCPLRFVALFGRCQAEVFDESRIWAV